MTIEAKVICDSISEAGKRLTTFELKYPRFIHAEELTHRVLRTSPEMIEIVHVPDGLMYDQHLSRNASSSRAIPVKRMIEAVLEDPAMPVWWGKNQPGMQAREEHDAPVLLPDQDLFSPLAFARLKPVDKKTVWLRARDMMVMIARAYADADYHKQIVNRLLEPWAHIKVVVTATEYDNFFALRRHEDAQPEIKVLADKMWEARKGSTPKLLGMGEWHLPYVTREDWVLCPDPAWLVKVSAARCARTSYWTHEGKIPLIEDDLILFKRLATANPMHASPMEHQAMPDMRPTHPSDVMNDWCFENEHGNYVGWRQFRRMLPGGIV